jgi:hypothetical protein
VEEPKSKALISRTHLALSLFALSGWAAFYFKSKTPDKTSEKIVYRDREIFKDRIIYKEKIISKDITKTVTKPDGTKIVTVSKVGVTESAKTNEVTRERERLEEKESVTLKPHSQSLYSFGFSYVFDYRRPLYQAYEFEYSQRLWITPVWGKIAVDTNRYITLGGRWEF